MKEQRIVVEIDPEGRMTADAEGFSGDACLQDLERLLDGLGAGTHSVKRKPEAGKVQVQKRTVQKVGRRG